jgi:hypothetical protein
VEGHGRCPELKERERRGRMRAIYDAVVAIRAASV